MTKFPKGFTAIVFIAACAMSIGADATIKRSSAERNAFQREHPCPSNGATKGKCPKWVVDHPMPLCAGGLDKRSNMAWSQLKESIAKDKEEWRLCRAIKSGAFSICTTPFEISIDKYYSC